MICTLQESLDKPLAMENIDTASGVLFPFWDEGTRMVYLVGKVKYGLVLLSVLTGRLSSVQGDSQIRYFEVTPPEEDKKEGKDRVYFLSMYQTNIPGRSVCAMPKKDLDYMKCEVMRFFKLQHTKNIVEPTSMTVPRKVRLWIANYSLLCPLPPQSDMFQDDIFPPCPSGEPALSAEEWAGGVDKPPKLMSLNEGGGAVASTGPKVSVVNDSQC